jgi:hypothetical protein
MQCFRKTVAWLSIVSVSAASFCGGSTCAAPQKDTLCTESKVVEQSCANFIWVDAERGKPFVAERMVRSVKFLSPSNEDVEVIAPEETVVARDTKGRIREEFHVWYLGAASSHRILALGGVASSHRDLNTGVPIVDDPGELTVSILDCFGGKRIQLTPSTQTAIVQESCAQLPIFQPSDRPYSYRLTRVLNANSGPDTTVEDLGYKQLQTLQARGIKITWRGSEKDGDWKGKPTKIWEEWMSDELGVTLMWTYSDLRNQVENRGILQNIRREEPDASLFTVPSGYKITNWK